MTDIQKKKRFLSLGNFIFVTILLVAFAVKLEVFYLQIRLGGYDLCFTLMTLGIIVLLASLIGLISHKAGRVFLFVMYVAMSFIMAVDGVYYAYVSKLPSAIQAGMAWQLDDVADTIAGLIKFHHVLNLIDFPLWLIWLINRDLIRSKTPRLSAALEKPFINRFAFSGIMILISALFASYDFFIRDFRPEYFDNELLYYHTTDLYKCFIAPPAKKEVDKSLYVSPDRSESEYYGLAEGRNVFIVQVEAMQNFVIGASYEGQELTPNLNSLIGDNSFYFDNYYYQIGGGNTADAEFAVNNSLFAPESEAAYVKYPDNDYFGLPKLLKENGYTGAHAFHGYEGIFWNREYAYPSQGFDDYTSLEDFEPTEMFPMGLSDHEFFRQSLEKIKTFEEPFYSFMITLSSHYPFALPLEAREITLKAEDEATLFGLYIQSMNYVDRMIAEFIDGLKEAGLYDNSIIVIYGDHYALTNTDSGNSTRVKSMLGRNYTIYDVFNVPLIIHIPGLGESETVSTAGGHIDVLPTLLCLLGINNDKAVMFGQNLLDAEHGFVCEQTHVSRGSFISDDVFFQKPFNKIKTNYFAYEYGTMALLDPDDFTEESDYSAARIEDCMSLLNDNDILLD